MSHRGRGAPKNLSESDRWVFLTHERFALWRLISKMLGVALIVFLAVPLPVLWGAGQETVITLTYKAILEGKLADKVQKGTIAVLVLLVLFQRWHYTRRLRHLGGRSEELERKLDPGRSSSHPMNRP